MTAYEFSILRYSYDPLTEEFINVGIVVYSPTARFLQAKVSTNYGRASKVFGRIDGNRFRSALRHIQGELDEISAELHKGHLFGLPADLKSTLSQILPIDDSSLRFDRGGTGVANDLLKTCDRIFKRYVASSEPTAIDCRTREDVWRTFRRPLEKLAITNRLVPKRIVGKDYGYEFEHAWKNGVWNLYEPISFDLLEEFAIREKANKWLGRALCLNESAEPFKLTVLIGAPQSNRMKDAFQHAENILNKMPGKKEIVREEEAEQFALELESELKHSDLSIAK